MISSSSFIFVLFSDKSLGYLSSQKFYLGLFMITSMTLLKHFNTTTFISFSAKSNSHVSSQSALIDWFYFHFTANKFPESLHAWSSLIGSRHCGLQLFISINIIELYNRMNLHYSEIVSSFYTLLFKICLTGPEQCLV